MAPLNNGVGNLSAGLMRLPMIQAQGRMMQQRAGLYQEEAAKNAADVGLVGAQTDHEKALTGKETQGLFWGLPREKVNSFYKEDHTAQISQ